VVFSRVGPSRYRGANAEGAVLVALDQKGEFLYEFGAPGVSVHLFDIERPESASPQTARGVGAG